MARLCGSVRGSILGSLPFGPGNHRRRLSINMQEMLIRTDHAQLFTSNRRCSSSIQMDYGIYQRPHSQLKSPSIFLLHGLNVSRSIWRRTARHMAKLGSRILIAADARNHGMSPHHREHTPMAMAADVTTFIDTYDLRRIVALGHNVGGRAMMTLALTRPDLVERAIIVDITPGPLPAEVVNASKLFELMVSVTPTIPRELSLAEGRRFVIPKFSKLIDRDTDIFTIVHNLNKLEDGSFSWNVNAEAILNGWDATMVNYEQSLKGLDPYQGETLLIAASRDKFVTPANIEIMRKYFPKLHVEYLDAEHKVYMDQPDKFVRLVVDFTKACTGCPI